MIMDRAYEGDETRQLVLELGFTPVVPPKQNRVNPWEYDRIMYRRRNDRAVVSAAKRLSEDLLPL